MIKKIIVAFVVLITLIIFIFEFVMPRIGTALLSTRTKNSYCRKKIKSYATRLTEFNSQHNRLPDTQEEFWSYIDERYFNKYDDIKKCWFNTKKSLSYVYLPPNQKSEDNTGQQVIMYCDAEHPNVVTFPDDDPGPGTKAVIRPDLSVEVIKASEFSIQKIP